MTLPAAVFGFSLVAPPRSPCANHGSFHPLDNKNSKGCHNSVVPLARGGTTARHIGTGFSFGDGEQVLVSLQKLLGIVLEQDSTDDGTTTATTTGATAPPIMVAAMDPSGNAAQAGVQVGDVLVAVQNASVENQSLEYVLAFLGQAPRVVNLRFVRV